MEKSHRLVVVQTSVDRATIFTEILKRQALRRGAKLPLLDVRQEYHRLVRLAEWRVHVDQNGEKVRTEILAQQRAKHGQDFGLSWGGRMALSILVQRELVASYQEQARLPRFVTAR